MSQYIPFREWTHETDYSAFLRYRGHTLRISENRRTGYCDGYIDNSDADMHCQSTTHGLESLSGMLQRAVDKRIDDSSFKYHIGQRVHSALCADGKVRGNGVIDMRRYIADGEYPDNEPAYMVCFAGEHHHVSESNIKP